MGNIYLSQFLIYSGLR